MAVKINLLPPELSVSGGLGKLLRTTRAIGVVALVLFLLFILSLIGLFLINTFTLRNLRTDVANLENQIKAREVSEQQVVLLKDRIIKINTALNVPGAAQNLENADPLFSVITGGSTINQFEADFQKISLAVNIRSNSDLTAFLNAIGGITTFKTVTLSSFGFNPVSGYLVGVSLVK